jgi:RND superfamily putative drug exporter
LHLLVGGTQAQSVDTSEALFDRFPWMVAFIFVLSYILLLLMLRSVVLPLLAVVMTVLSVGATFGAVIFIYQQGHLAQLFHTTASGSVDALLPIILFCLLFGLSMDYQVFLVSRMREEWLKTGNNMTAVAQGVEKTGGVITSAALLFAVAAGAFVFASISTTQAVGFGLAMAVLVDAFLVRALLVPSVMRLVGRANWWFPRWPSRNTRHIS